MFDAFRLQARFSISCLPLRSLKRLRDTVRYGQDGFDEERHPVRVNRPDSPYTENLNTVVVRYISPGRSTVDGKAGWFGESG